MTSDVKRPRKTFELRSGPMPALKPAAPSQPAAAKAAGLTADQPGETEQPSCTSERDIILRIVEAVKNL